MNFEDEERESLPYYYPEHGDWTDTLPYGMRFSKSFYFKGSILEITNLLKRGGVCIVGEGGAGKSSLVLEVSEFLSTQKQTPHTLFSGKEIQYNLEKILDITRKLIEYRAIHPSKKTIVIIDSGDYLALNPSGYKPEIIQAKRELLTLLLDKDFVVITTRHSDWVTPEQAQDNKMLDSRFNQDLYDLWQQLLDKLKEHRLNKGLELDSRINLLRDNLYQQWELYKMDKDLFKNPFGEDISDEKNELIRSIAEDLYVSYKMLKRFSINRFYDLLKALSEGKLQ